MAKSWMPASEEEIKREFDLEVAKNRADPKKQIGRDWLEICRFISTGQMPKDVAREYIIDCRRGAR